jgi:hypothetical protein
MKKKIWNTESTPRSTPNGRGQYLSLNKNGSILLSKDLVEGLKLTGQRINFIQDEDRPQDWYIEPTKDQTGFELREKKAAAGYVSFIIQCQSIRKNILESNKLPIDVAHRVLVAELPVEKITPPIYAILTKSAKQK